MNRLCTRICTRNRTLPSLLAIAALVGVTPSASAQESGVGPYVDAVLKAVERSGAQDWAGAAPLWERVVETNPDVASFWYSLAIARQNLGEHRKAIPALEKALELGAGTPNRVAYSLAQAHALLGENKAAMNRLGQAVELGFRSRERIRTDEAFASLRDDPTFQTLAALVDTGAMSRTEGWCYDISFLETEVKRMHYSPFRKVSQEEFENDLRKLQGEVPQLTDNQITVGLMRAMRKIGDGHTGISPDLLRAWDHTVPLQFGLFSEGLFVTSAEPRHAELVGAQVLRIGDHTIEQVIQALTPTVHQDNVQGVIRGATDRLRYPQVLSGLGLQSETDSIRLTVLAHDGKERTLTVQAAATDPQFNRIRGHPDWPTVHGTSQASIPVYLKDRHLPYRFEQLDDKTVYFQFNVVTNDPSEPFDRFVNRLFEHIDANRIHKLIIDLRWNNGGNSLLLPPLVRALIRAETINRPGHLFLIIGRYTFSAGMNAATYIEAETEAVLVGEPTPSSPNFVGESNIISLPYSGVRVSISDIYWQSSWPIDHRTWVAPLLHSPPSFEAYKAGRDVAMEAILAYPQTDPATAPNPVVGSAADEVKRLEREWLDAYQNHDAAAMDRIVADDFTITFPDGTIQTKPQLIEQVRAPRNPNQPEPKFLTQNVRWRAYGDTVILVGTVITEVRRGDEVVREQSLYTDTYVKRDGRWQVVASHLSKVAKAMP